MKALQTFALYSLLLGGLLLPFPVEARNNGKKNSNNNNRKTSASHSSSRNLSPSNRASVVNGGFNPRSSSVKKPSSSSRSNVVRSSGSKSSSSKKSSSSSNRSQSSGSVKKSPSGGVRYVSPKPKSPSKPTSVSSSKSGSSSKSKSSSKAKSPSAYTVSNRAAAVNGIGAGSGPRYTPSINVPKSVKKPGSGGGSKSPSKSSSRGHSKSPSKNVVKSSHPNVKHPAHHGNHKKPSRVDHVIANYRGPHHGSHAKQANHAGHGHSKYSHSRSIWNPGFVSSHGQHRGYSHPNGIHKNFSNSVNYAYRPNAWGSRPWWSSSNHHSWHRGCWDYGWNSRYQRSHSRSFAPHSFYPPGYHPHTSVSSALPWGIAAWSLGSLFFDTGYGSYHNPYPAPPVTTRTRVYDYHQPITVIGAETEPLPENEEISADEEVEAAMGRARDFFRGLNYEGALAVIDEAIAVAPADPALHEFRALALFALQRYDEAAGVLNPVLASGPGWDWSTLIGFYLQSDHYEGQLRRLENHVEASPEDAGSHFLLGYHYMVAGHLAQAHHLFATVVELEPGDAVARQLRDLAGSTMPVEDGEETEMVVETGDPVVPVAPEELEGTWTALSSNGKVITLKLADDGTFSWNYEGAGEGDVLVGDWNVDDEGRLVLDDEDAQLVGEIELLDDETMRYVLAGSPEGDPGLVFSRL